MFTLVGTSNHDRVPPAHKIWFFVGPEPQLVYVPIVTVSALIIASPCTLELAKPMSIMVATSKGTTMGVLFKRLKQKK
ncbi:MAG: hypothetical protein WBB23_23010 [Desulforhopalus sp.]